MSSQYHFESSLREASSISESFKQRLIWGTQLSITETSDQIKEILHLNYNSLIKPLIVSNTSTTLVLNLEPSVLSPTLLNLLLNYPVDFLSIFEHCLAEVVFEFLPCSVVSKFFVRFVDVGYFYKNVSSFLIEKMVRLRGVVVKSLCIVPEPVLKVFTCVYCSCDLVLSDNYVNEDGAKKVNKKKELIDPEHLFCQNVHRSGKFNEKSMNNKSIYDEMNNLIEKKNTHDNFNNNLLNNSSNDIPTTPESFSSTYSQDICTNCNTRYSLELNRLKTQFIDTQTIYLQELPSDTTSGTTPSCFEVVVKNDFCSSIVPGMKINISGVLKLKSEQTKDLKFIKQSFKTYIEMLSFRKINITEEEYNRDEESLNENKVANSMNSMNENKVAYSINSINENKAVNCINENNVDLDFNDTKIINGLNENKIESPFNDNRIENDSIKSNGILNGSHASDSFGNSFNPSNLSSLNENTLIPILINSIAPQVFSHSFTKLSLLLQLVGGTDKPNLRNSIHILLIGDPGIAKSQLLKFIQRISKGYYSSGRGSSACGLTASVVKHKNSFILEPGAIILSNNTICCIDEFDKMNQSTKSVLHEIMEQQSVSISKAGIVTSLKAKTSILASCNPIRSKYDQSLSVLENINLKCSLLSRFDIVCVMIDQQNDKKDSQIGEHIINLYTNEELEEQDPDNITKKEEHNLYNSNKNKEHDPDNITKKEEHNLYNSNKNKEHDPDNITKKEEHNLSHVMKKIEQSQLDNSQILNAQFFNSNFDNNCPFTLKDYKQPNKLFNYSSTNPKSNQFLHPNLLKTYIQTCKELKPILTKKSKEILKKLYTKMRQLNNGKTITATCRQLEALIRLSEAIAKIKMKNVVEENDCKLAYELLTETMCLYAIDPKTGIMDLDLINTGRSTTERKLRSEILEKIENEINKGSKLDLDKYIKEYGNEIIESLIKENKIHL